MNKPWWSAGGHEELKKKNADKFRPIGSVAYRNGEKVLWAGERWLYQSPEMFEQLKDQGEFKFLNITGHQMREGALSIIPRETKDAVKKQISDTSNLLAEGDDAMLLLSQVYNPGSTLSIVQERKKASEAVSAVMTPLSKASKWFSDVTNTAPWLSDEIGAALITGGTSLVARRFMQAVKAANMARKISVATDRVTTTANLARKVGTNSWPVIDAGTLGLGDPTPLIKRSRVLSTGQQRLLQVLTPENLKNISDPGLQTLYKKASLMLNTPGLSKRNAEVLLQTGPDSPLLKKIADIDDPVKLNKAITSYFTQKGQYFSGGFNFNLDHLVPISSTAKLASKVSPQVFQDALALQLKKFGRRFGHDQEFSLIPRRTHAVKHTGAPLLKGQSPDWKTKYLDKIIDDLPENATAEQVSDALSKMYDKSIQKTGEALSDPDFFSIREAVLDTLPSKFREKLGENFDITGRISSVETPELWREFKLYLKDAHPTLKTIVQNQSQVNPQVLTELDLLNSNRYNQ